MNRREAYRFHYATAVRVVGGDLQEVHCAASAHALRALKEEDSLFGSHEQTVAQLEAELERLRKMTADQGEQISALTAENRDLARDAMTCSEGWDDLCEVLWGNEEGRPRAIDIGVLAHWHQLRDRHVAQMAKAASLINAGRGVVAHELAETQKQAASLVAEVSGKEQQLQNLESILDALWETFYSGKEMPDDLEPHEIARQICEAWANLGSEHLRKEEELHDELRTLREQAHQREQEAAGAVAAIQDGLAELQTASRGAVPVEKLKAVLDGWWERRRALEARPELGLGNAKASAIDDCAAELARLLVEYQPAPAAPGLLGGANLVKPAAELALGKQMGDALAAVVGGPVGG